LLSLPVAGKEAFFAKEAKEAPVSAGKDAKEAKEAKEAPCPTS
jgi:hypothetical protein